MLTTSSLPEVHKEYKQYQTVFDLRYILLFFFLALLKVAINTSNFKVKFIFKLYLDTFKVYSHLNVINKPKLYLKNIFALNVIFFCILQHFNFIFILLIQLHISLVNNHFPNGELQVIVIISSSFFAHHIWKNSFQFTILREMLHSVLNLAQTLA